MDHVIAISSVKQHRAFRERRAYLARVEEHTGALLISVASLVFASPANTSAPASRELFILLRACSATDTDSTDNLTVDRDRDSAL